MLNTMLVLNICYCLCYVCRECTCTSEGTSEASHGGKLHLLENVMGNYFMNASSTFSCDGFVHTCQDTSSLSILMSVVVVF
jgi:hypothetical protein